MSACLPTTLPHVGTPCNLLATSPCPLSLKHHHNQPKLWLRNKYGHDRALARAGREKILVFVRYSCRSCSTGIAIKDKKSSHTSFVFFLFLFFKLLFFIYNVHFLLYTFYKGPKSSILSCSQFAIKKQQRLAS